MLAALLLLLGPACATYDERMERHHEAFYGGRLPDAVLSLREAVDEADDEDLDLLRLELCSALIALGEEREAAELLAQVDDGLEVLDYTTDTIEDVGAFAFSGELATWRASPPERIMVNTQAMVARLMAGDLEGAQVEARRLGILLDQPDIPEDEKYVNAFAVALAAFCLEQGGNPLESGDFSSRLTNDPFAPGLVGADVAAKRTDDGETGTVLVVAQTGQAPIRREAIYVLWIDELPRTLRVPVMVPREASFDRVVVEVDGTSHGAVPVAFDLGEHLLQRHEDELYTLLPAAATQAAIRAAAAEAAKGAGAAAGGDDYGALTGLLAGVITELALGEIMTTDTRCWSLLPRHLGALRLELPVGTHLIDLELWSPVGLRREVTHIVEVTPGGLVTLNVVTDAYGIYREPPEAREVDDPEHPAVLDAIAAFETAFAIGAIID